MNPSEFKKYNMASIVRATDNSTALKHQIGFLIKVLDKLGFKFSGCEHDPLRLAREYVAGEIPIGQCKAQVSGWWAKIDEKEAARQFHDREILMARLAICLLSNDEEDISVLGDNLSWFFEVLGFLGVDMKQPFEMMKEYFEFKSTI